MQTRTKLRKRLRNWLSSIILIKTRMTLMQLKKSSRKLLMHTKFYQTLRRDKYMINRERKELRERKLAKVAVVDSMEECILIMKKYSNNSSGSNKVDKREDNNNSILTLGVVVVSSSNKLLQKKIYLKTVMY